MSELFSFLMTFVHGSIQNIRAAGINVKVKSTPDGRIDLAVVLRLLGSEV